MSLVSKSLFFTNHVENNHPAFLLIPFRVEDIFLNADIYRKHKIDLTRLMQQRYPEKHVTITSSARKALSLVLDQIRKTSTPSKISIQTTSDNFYISGCVTDTIEQKDRWFRNDSQEADVILVNHEFGYADNRMVLGNIDSTKFIEDCAFSFNTKYINEERVGSVAPFSIFSFSKFFPIQIGGCLISDVPMETEENPEFITYIERIVGYYFDRIEEWSALRLDALKYYSEVFESLGCTPFFPKLKTDIPGVFLFNIPTGIDKQELKKFYWKRGVQCSAFYGKEAFFLPLNQYTTHSHIDFFGEIFKSFLTENCE